MMRQFLDVVHQAAKLPLGVHFLAPAQREAVQPLVGHQVAEHRLHRGEAPRDHLLAVLGIAAKGPQLRGRGRIVFQPLR